MRWWTLTLVVTGCSTIFGLDNARDDDLDGDHIPDELDNCPTVPNPDQSDVDGNGIGDLCDGCSSPDPTDQDGDGIPDACDGCDNRLPDANGDGVPDACENANQCVDCTPCSMGPSHDEDGDHTPDGCDFCPAVMSLNADDLDGDGVGDACDTSIVKSEQRFDPFRTLSPAWYSTGPWTLEADRIAVTLPLAAFAFRQLGTGFRNFSVQSHMTTTPDPAAAAKSSGVLVYASDRQDPFNAGSSYGCELDIGTGPPVLIVRTSTVGTASSTFATLSGAGPWTITLHVTANKVNCTAVADDDPITDVTLPNNNPVALYLTGIAAYGPGTGVFDYFDVVSDAH